MLVAGGTGGVGEACVRALLADPGYERVIVSSRERTKLSALRDRVGKSGSRLVTLVGSLSTSREAERLRSHVCAFGELDAAVASLGGWWDGGALLEVDDDCWRRVLDELLTTHFVCARTFVPVLTAGRGRYLAIGGGAGLTPVIDSSLVSIAAAAQAMMIRALVAERGNRAGPWINELLIDAPVKTRGRHHGPLQQAEITADEVAAVVRSWLRSGTTDGWPQIERNGPIILMRPRDDRSRG